MADYRDTYFPMSAVDKETAKKNNQENNKYHQSTPSRPRKSDILKTLEKHSKTIDNYREDPVTRDIINKEALILSFGNDG